MLTALIIGWAAITVIVIAVSIIAIRGQRHGAEDEEVLIPWGDQQSPLAYDPGQIDDDDRASVSVKKGSSKKKKSKVHSHHKLDSFVEEPQPLFSVQNKLSGGDIESPQYSVNHLSTHSDLEVDSEMATSDDSQLEPAIGSEKQFILTLKQALAAEINIWRSLSHNDLTANILDNGAEDSSTVVSIDQENNAKTGLENAPTLYSLHINDSFRPICLIHIEKKTTLSGKLIKRKAIEHVRRLAAEKKLPLIRVDESHPYTKSEIQDLLAFQLPSRLLSARESTEQVEKQPEEQEDVTAESKEKAQSQASDHSHSHGQGSEKICPRCSSSMSKKIATRGKYAGTRFWACNSYPDCRQVEIIHREYAAEPKEAQSS